MTTSVLVAAILLIMAVLGFAVQMHRFTKKILSALPRGDEGRNDRERIVKELAVLKNDVREQVASLRVAFEEVPGRVQQRVQHLLAQKQPERHRDPVPSYDVYEEAHPQEDAGAQLLALANRIVQQTSTTLEAFRASTSRFSVRVAPWPSTAEGTPSAFIVEYAGRCYAVPNVVKPARLPQEWFNRAEFGVNDEIQRVVSLPLLRRRGNDYDVDVPGVFAR